MLFHANRKVLPVLETVHQNIKGALRLEVAVVLLLVLEPHHVQPFIERVFDPALCVYATDLDLPGAHHGCADIDAGIVYDHFFAVRRIVSIDLFTSARPDFAIEAPPLQVIVVFVNAT